MGTDGNDDAKKPNLKALLGKLPTSVKLDHVSFDEAKKEAVIVLTFSEKGFGWGEVTLVQTPEGLFLDSEYMGIDQVRKYVNLLLDGAILDTDQDPEKHRLYNQAMGRSCGDGCPVCGKGESGPERPGEPESPVS